MHTKRACPAVITVNPSLPIPLVRQVYDALLAQIAASAMKPGDRLPSVRALSADCGVSTMTITNAYQRLVAEGHVEARRASGYYVAEAERSTATRRKPFLGRTSVDSLWLLKHVYEDDRTLLNAGCGWVPPEMLHIDGVRRALAALSRKSAAGLANYGTPYGYLPLRQQIQLLLAQQDIETEPHQIVLTHGASQALNLVARCLLQPRDVVLVDEPGSTNLYAMLRSLDLKLVGVERTVNGPDLAALQALAQRHAQTTTGRSTPSPAPRCRRRCGTRQRAQSCGRDVAQQPAHAQPGAHERKHQADREHRQVGHRQQRALLVEAVGARADQRGHGQEEGEVGRGLARQAQQHAADDGRAAAAGAGDHRQALHQADLERVHQGVMSSTSWMRATAGLFCWRFSAHRMMKPPRMKVLATTTGVNRCALMALPNSRPSTTAGRKATSTLSTKRCAFSRSAAPRRCADLLPVDQDHREDGAGLDRDVEDLGLVVVKTSKDAGQDQVARSRRSAGTRSGPRRCP
jgi:DNA-binding transcriptional regulator YhcF (GntR family)